MSKNIFFLIILSLVIKSVQAQEKPLNLEASYVSDYVSNVSGGLSKGSGFLGMFNLKLSFNTENANLWNGGEFFVNGAKTYGIKPTSDFVGDYQGISNIEAGDLLYVHELWYKQSYNDFSLIVGLQDLVAEFAYSDYGNLFLNGSFGVHSTLSHNIPAPIFPLTAVGIQFQWNIEDFMNAKVAVFDGLPEDFENNPHNLKWNLNSKDGALSVGEIGFTSEIFEGLNGSYKFGGYYHNHLIDPENPEQNSNNYGFYFSADQELFKGENNKTFGLFAQGGLSPYKINDNYYYMGLGLNYTGMIEGRNNDVAGLGIAYAGFSSAAKKDEITFELTYKAELFNYFFIQPDLQYIVNPAGQDVTLQNSLAAILRFGVNL